MTKQRWWRSLAVSASLLSIATMAAALECSIASLTPAIATLKGKRLDLPVILPDCKGVEVSTGMILACIQDARQRLSCKEFEAVSVVNEQKLGPSGAGRGWLEVVRDLLSADPVSKSAVSRSGTLPDLPTGIVGLVNGDFEINFSDENLGGVSRVDFIDEVTREVIFSVPGIGRKAVTAQRFTPGRSYLWTLRADSPMLDEKTGRFSILSSNEMSVVRRETEIFVSDFNGGPAGQALMTAVWLKKQGLDFDAKQVLQKVRPYSP